LSWDVVQQLPEHVYAILTDELRRPAARE